MKSSTKDKIEGTAEKVSGKIKEGLGNTTNNQRLASEGRVEQADGKVKNKIGDVKKVFDR
ncbi:MAG: CsbD family protein [Verrucomicrobiota bacterium]|nr:CsbD family protein [Verrucomicrobiota bacterium]